MSEELRPCPFCGKKPNPNWTDESYIECTNRKCSVYGYGMSTGDWNTRPIEDALQARAEKAEEMVEWLIELGDVINGDKDSVWTLRTVKERWTIEVAKWKEREG